MQHRDSRVIENPEACDASAKFARILSLQTREIAVFGLKVFSEGR